MVGNVYSSVLIILTLSIVICQLDHATGYPDGAPSRVCETMLPSHGEETLTSDIPFDIKLDRRHVRGLNAINIEVISKQPSKIKLAGALFIVKRENDAKQAFGRFDPSPSSREAPLKTIDCFGKKDSGMTQANATLKTSLKFKWIAPNDTSADYELHATLVRDFNDFWANYIHPQKIHVRVTAPPSSAHKIRLSSVYIITSAVAALLYIH